MKNMSYGEIGFRVFIASMLLLVSMAIQCIFQGMTTNDIYQFEVYGIMGWIGQVLYWTLSIGATAALTYDAQSPV